MSVLLLAGTTEGRHIAAAMAEEGIAGHASIAGVTEDPAPLALPTRIGGFGGAEGFEAFLEDRGIRAVVDATHPYAAAECLQLPQSARNLWIQSGEPRQRHGSYEL